MDTLLQNTQGSSNQDKAPLEGLTPLQLGALEKLMSSRTITGAARAAKVSESSIHAWLKLPAFRLALHDAFRARFDLLNLDAVKLGRLAFKVLEDVMNDPTAPAMARVGAASRVLDAIHKAYELVGVTERLDALEAKLGGIDGQV